MSKSSKPGLIFCTSAGAVHSLLKSSDGDGLLSDLHRENNEEKKTAKTKKIITEKVLQNLDFWQNRSWLVFIMQMNCMNSKNGWIPFGKVSVNPPSLRFGGQSPN